MHHFFPVCKSCGERLSKGYKQYEFPWSNDNNQYSFNNYHQDKTLVHAEICNKSFDVNGYKASDLTVKGV